MRPVKTSPSPQRPTRSALFAFLILAAWLCAAAVAKWNEPWLYLLLGFTVLLASWLGRRQAAALRILLLLALFFPIGKTIRQRFTHSPATATRSSPNSPAALPSEQNDAAVIRALVTAEETCLALNPKMAALSRALQNLRLPGPAAETEGIFASSVKVTDLAPLPPQATPGPPLFESATWPVNRESVEVTKIDLWRPLLEAVSWFEHATVRVINGEHPEGDPYRFEANGDFEALAKMTSGSWFSLHGPLQLSWRRERATPGGPPPAWQIVAWKTGELRWTASPQRLFAESLDTALPVPGDLAKLRHSPHYEATVKYYRDNMKSPPHPYFAPISANQKEGVAVADVDGDGLDDIYVTMRLGKNMLLRNRGDGTFTEEAAARGLDLPGHTTCALFADFDNDGDLDLLLGRSLLKSTYLENRDGRYHQHPIPPHFPMAVISMAAADYNGDGLLDVYLCTYRPAAPPGASPAGGVAQIKEGDFDWPDEFFSPDQAREYRRRAAEHRQRKGGTVLDQLGPPNVLLVNRGGGNFEIAPENSTVGLWRNSLQATWGDFDQDGDPDLFIANDWAPSVLFRNDGPAGFTDITALAGTLSYGFSMGASWGDYDNDGLEDIYVSNMFSEPGRRMTTRIPGLDRMFLESAAGNWLYHQESPGKFRQVAGQTPAPMAVLDAGWSWGGCFADFDNDRFLDLYVLSGYFTAPPELSSDLDLESNLWRTMVRTDENLSRGSFRFSPEWKRTPAPDSLGPQIDARLAGVERQGEKTVVHSLNGHERNHYFANRQGRSFVDLSGLSGVDNPADSRGFAVLDYDRDGWQDIALVNANQPLFNLYHNEMPAAGLAGGIIAIRFVGGNRTSASTKGWACRDGYGARVTVDLGDQKLLREHRCGEGWSTQNSATMILGLGPQTTAAAVTVRWPSGKTTSTQSVPEGTLLIAYENPADAPSAEPFVRQPYRRKPSPRPATTKPAGPVFPLHLVDATARPARLRLYLTFATALPSGNLPLPVLRQIKEVLGAEGLDVAAVPIDPEDTNQKLAAYAREQKPPVRLVNVPPAQRGEASAAFHQLLGATPHGPATVITDDAGHILSVQSGVPTISELRKWLATSSRKN